MKSLARAVLRVVPLSHIPLTVRHFADFGAERERVGDALVNPRSWDAVRELPGPFELPSTRADWERAAGGGDFAERAAAIAAVADELGAKRIASYGVGAGFVELNLALLRPDLELVCTDYTERALGRLTELFPEAEVRRHDLRTDPPLTADLHLFHRIDTELANNQWRDVFPRFHEPILLVATELLQTHSLLRELRLRRSPSASDAGYIRTEAALRSLWRRSHRDTPLAVGPYAGFLLRDRDIVAS